MGLKRNMGNTLSCLVPSFHMSWTVIYIVFAIITVFQILQKNVPYFPCRFYCIRVINAITFVSNLPNFTMTTKMGLNQMALQLSSELAIFHLWHRSTHHVIRGSASYSHH